MKKARLSIAALTAFILMSCGGLGTSSTSGSSILGDIIGAATSGGTIVNAISSVIGLDKMSASELVGTWKFQGPGCAFTSENLLAKAGGEVAATTVKEKLNPYYKQMGLSASNTHVTFYSDKRFAASIAGKEFSGTYTFDESTQQVTLKTLLLSVNAYTKRDSGGMDLLFESKKLLTLLQTLATLSGNSTAQSISDLSKNYDGVRVGFLMKK